jgi:RNA ligase (TIGR02306 family)
MRYRAWHHRHRSRAGVWESPWQGARDRCRPRCGGAAYHVAPASPKAILLAKSEIHGIHIWQAGENLVCQHAAGRENGFASSIKSGQEPKNNEKNTGNVYVRMFRELTKETPWRTRILPHAEGSVFVLGEIFGKGIQDLHYGEAMPRFRVFDVYSGKTHSYFERDLLTYFIRSSGLAGVVELYRGPYDRTTIDEFVTGDTITGSGHIREGVVIMPLNERRDDELGRVILKHINEDYLLRKGNVTEFT